jgi:hypothetical protein
MATYGYSTPYTGQQVQTLPPGYLEAATAPGRNLAMGIAAMGQGLGKAIEQYRTKKAETEAATQSWETVSGLMQQQLASDPKYLAIQQYMETGALPQGVTEQDIPRYTQQVQADREMLNKFSALGEKFPDMSLAKKKAALGDAVMVLNQYRTDQQNQVRDAAARQQLRLVELQLQEAQDKRRQNEILTSAIRYGLEQPTTTTQTQQVTDTIEFPPMPGVPTPAVQSTPSQAEATAARYFMGRYGQAAQQLQQYGAGLGRQANALNVSQTPRFTGPISLGQEDNEAYLSQQFESPIEAAARAEANTRLKEQQLAESQAALQQAGIMSRSPALKTIGPRTLQPAQETAPMQQPPETITRNVSTQVPISYEDQSKRLTQFLVQQGAKPETIAMVPQILSMVGQQRPTRVEQVGNIGSVVRFGNDKEQFVPAKEANIGDMLKVRGLTIDFPEFRGTAPTEAEASKFREQYSNVLDSRKAIAELLDIAKMGTAMQQTPEVRARANSLASGLRGIERINIIGPGTITPEDFKLLNSVIPDPTSIFSLKKSNIQAFETMLQKSARAIESRAKSIGLEVLKPDQQQTVSSLLNDPRVASIRARAASGAITRQQAAQELKSIQ